MKPIFLTGIKHSGKTTLGKLLAEQLGQEFIDIDEVITEHDMSPREIFLSRGEDGFKDAEFCACGEVCSSFSQGSAIIATGGGICDNILAMSLIRKTGFVVYLDVSENIALNRILAAAKAADGTLQNLPAYIAKENPCTDAEVQKIFHGVYEKRSKKYTLFADAVFVPAALPPDQNAQKLADMLRAEFALV